MRLFRTVWAEFRAVWAKFLGFFADSPDMIFGQSWTVSRFRFDSGTDIFRFCGVFWYPNNSVTNRGGTKRCLVLCGSEI